MSTDAAATTPESAITVGQQNHQPKANQKSFSCILCAQRKVKCDKTPSGCSNCYKARVDCIYKVPPSPRRQKRGGARDVDTRVRLRIYEDALRKLGIDPEALVKKDLVRAKRRLSISTSKAVNDFYECAVLPESEKSDRIHDQGMLVSGDGRSRYLENTLWTSLKGEFRDSKEILDDSSSSDDEDDAASPSSFSLTNGGILLLGSSKSVVDLYSLHPQPMQIFKLWQAYLDNVNPLMKVFHTPTVQQIISRATGSLEDIPRNTEALLFSIYAMSLESLTDPQCMEIMKESKAIVSRRLRTATKMALINANFLKTSDIMVLQALVLYIASIQNDDPRVIWILTGVAGRIAQRLGLHRDPDTLNLPPFDSEIRRRLWWQTIMQDGFAEKLAGTGRTSMVSEVKKPANLNDSDLYPDMRELPKEHEGATEMMFFLIRVHLGAFVTKSTINTTSSFDGVWNKISSNTITLDVKLQAINELEAMYQRNCLQYCDESVAWHLLCSILTKSIICMLRFMAHNPKHPGHSQDNLTQPQRDMLFRTALAIIEYHNIVYTNQALHGFLWHVEAHFQWKSFLYILAELCHRTTGAEVDKAWKQVELVYSFHPHFTKESTRAAFVLAVTNLTLKAWDAHRAALVVPLERDPRFIQILRARKAKRENPTPSNSHASSYAPPHASQLAHFQNQNIDHNTVPSPLQNIYTAPAPHTTQSARKFNLHPTDDPTHLDPSSMTAPPTDTFSFAPQQQPQTTAAFADDDPEQMNWASWDSLLADFDFNNVDFGPSSTEIGGGGDGGDGMDLNFDLAGFDIHGFGNGDGNGGGDGLR